MTGVLDGTRALIVGGSAGIGLAVARAMLAEGARVVIAGRSAARGAAALAALDHPRAAFLSADAGNPAACAALAVFLASDPAKRITGQTISVTGGISAI